jgi:hypothetical protein
MKLQIPTRSPASIVALWTGVILAAAGSGASAWADAGGGHSHGPEGPLLMKILGGVLIVGLGLAVYFGVLQKKKK